MVPLQNHLPACRPWTSVSFRSCLWRQGAKSKDAESETGRRATPIGVDAPGRAHTQPRITGRNGLLGPVAVVPFPLTVPAHDRTDTYTSHGYVRERAHTLTGESATADESQALGVGELVRI
eukprot:1735885-Prymnesium_polylepis.1